MEYSKQLKQLLTLGQDSPLDYSNLELGVEHADELIQMATDPKLLNADEGDTEFWATVHAWHILGQLKVTDAIAPLLDLREQYPFDLLFDKELPIAIGFMGEAAIPELKSYLFDSSRDEVARASVLPCLEELCLTYRRECLEIFSELLQQSDQDSRSLAGLAICALIDLKATETIETIREVFKRDCVDIGIPGDLEDVEIELGLRLKRETPKPKYNELSPEMSEAIKKIIEGIEPDTQPTGKVGRNDPCPCGSGKKYKKCCLH